MPGVAGHDETEYCTLGNSSPSLPCEELASAVDLGTGLLDNFYKVNVSIVYSSFTGVSMYPLL